MCTHFMPGRTIGLLLLQLIHTFEFLWSQVCTLHWRPVHQLAINWRSSYVSGLSNIDDQLRNPNINQSEAEHLGVACLDAPLTGSLLLKAYSVSFNLSHFLFASNILLSQINISLSGCNRAKCHPHFPFPNKR